MSETRSSVLVGVFVIVAIIALAMLVIAFGEMPEVMGGSRYQVVAKFETVDGISQGTRVIMRGITIGEIDALRLADAERPQAGTDVVLRIEEKYNIPDTAVGLVQFSAIGFGQARFLIEIPEPGTASLPKDGTAVMKGQMAETSIIPEDTFEILETAVARVGELAAALRPVAEDLHVLLQSRPVEQVDQPTTQAAAQLSANVSTAVERLNQLLRHFNDVLGDPEVKSNLREMVENITVASRDAKQIGTDLKAFSADAKRVAAAGTRVVAKVEQTVDNTNTQVTEVAERVKDLSGKLSKILDSVDGIMRTVADGEGTAGKLVRDERLYEELVLTIQRMRDAVDEFKILAKTLQEKGLLGG